MFKPMLATDANLSTLRFPMLASTKLDGIRAIVIDGKVMSRSLKPIPSAYVQSLFGHLEGLDGELIVGEPTAKDCYRTTVSHVMAHSKSDFDVAFYAFDHIAQPKAPFRERQQSMLQVVADNPTCGVVPLYQSHVRDMDGLLALESMQLDAGYEGLILRDIDAPYKFGRSTAKEGYLLKLKRFADAEAVVVGFEERMHNGNVATVDALGHTQRSSHAANKTGHGDLGALVCEYQGYQFNIGTGFTQAEREAIWANRDAHLGQLVKFKHFTVGAKDAPRHPVFLGFRDISDL